VAVNVSVLVGVGVQLRAPEVCVAAAVWVVLGVLVAVNVSVLVGVGVQLWAPEV
jgi:hypothetical protein